MSVVRNPDMIKCACSKEPSNLRLVFAFFFHVLDRVYLDGEGFQPYAPHQVTYHQDTGCPNAVFSPENVKFASSRL